MKKFTIFFIAVAFLSINSAALAAKNGANAQSAGQGTTTQMQQQLRVSPSPIGAQIQNQNQVTTQNMGEESELQVTNQEMEAEDDESLLKGVAPRSGVAQESMSAVAQKVEELLTTKATSGGIGDQVRLIAQEQKQAQEQLRIELDKVDNRKGLLKSLIGPDYKALKNMQMQMEQNQLRIQQLEQLQSQLANQGEATQIAEAIKVLTEQNTALQDRINLEEKSGGLLGWLFKRFVR